MDTRRATLSAVLVVLAACGGEDAPAPDPAAAPEEIRSTDDGEVFEDLDGAPGRWHRTGTLSDEQARAIAELEAIGYASGSELVDEGAERPSATGVTVHDRARAQPGLSFYTSGHGPEALLVDLDGAVRHRWQLAAAEVWPDEPELARLPGAANWRRARLFENGDVVALFAGVGLVRITRDSELVWSHRARVHHDLDVDERGAIWTLSRRIGLRPDVHPSEPVVDDTVLVLSATGEVLREFSLIDAFRASKFAAEPFVLPHGDVFHTNSIELLDGSHAERLPAFAAGNLLISLREPDLLAVVDPTPGAERVVWTLRARFRKQHDPQLLASGNLLLFDNLGLGERSRILELDAVTGERAWALGKTSDVSFFSGTCGTVSRLANGNTLVCESDGGRALEVTPEHELVWEFHSPHRAGDAGEFVATLFDLIRLPPEFPLDWLD